MLNKEIAEINWNDSAKDIHNIIRGLNPWPVAFTNFKGERMKIYESNPLNEESKEEPGTIISATKEGMKVSCGSNVLLIKKIQLPNGKPLTIEQYINGHKIEKKEKLG